jgi:hypothetical protein
VAECIHIRNHIKTGGKRTSENCKSGQIVGRDVHEGPHACSLHW